MPEAKLQTGKDLAGLVEKLADQVERRILLGEVIPPSEKIYSVFAPFPRWCSKGKAALGKLLKHAVLPRKGRLSKADRKRESAEAFRAGRRAYPAVESAINNLEQRGLDRVREKSKAGFARAVALSMLAPNLHRIGMIVRDRERERLKRKGLRRAA